MFLSQWKGNIILMVMLIWKRFWKLQVKSKCMLFFVQVHTSVQSGNGVAIQHGCLIKDPWNCVQLTLKCILTSFKNGSILFYQKSKDFNIHWEGTLLHFRSKMNMEVITLKVKCLKHQFLTIFQFQDHKYLPWLQTQMKNNGLVELFFTSDGGSNLKPVNLLEGVLHTVNFQEVGNNLERLKKVQPNKPMMVTEFWSGWFDHWGQEKHSTTTLEDYEKNVRQILDAGASINLYMFTGGTSFGFMSGSNHHGPSGLPLNDVTSYDYDAPLTEHGNWTAKYNITKKIIQVKQT